MNEFSILLNLVEMICTAISLFSIKKLILNKNLVIYDNRIEKITPLQL
ncbi:hypothetical protein MGWOODY_Mmi1100 [hydrothermal vent metagenome]|uniref:Uncharacterized protein n=1 Tax=hydrothermal vent metagenome TaxID=652676 RepID=A0A161JWI7_9ZZZZ